MPDKGLSPIAYLDKIEEENLLAGLGHNDDLKLDQVKEDMEKAREACENGDEKIFRERLLQMIERNSRWLVSGCRTHNKIGRAMNYMVESLKAYFRRKEGIRMAVAIIASALVSVMTSTGVFLGILAALKII